LPVGAALIWLTPNPNQARLIALLVVLFDLFLAIYIVIQFDTSIAGFQFVEQASWVPTLHINYRLGVDGISVLFPMFSIILFAFVILSSWNHVRNMSRLYYTLLMLLESATIGIFCATDTLLFFLFWELTLIPLFFLISLWGVGAHRRYAAVKYTLFMLAGGVPLLFAFIMLAFNHAEVHQLSIPAGLMFDYQTLLATPVSRELQTTIFILLALGFAAKTPLFPLHTWVPTVAFEGPTSVTALLTGLKLGAFGFIRYVVPLTAEMVQDYQVWLITLGMIGMIYGALIAMSQSNIRRMLAYASISHVGLVLIGIVSMNKQGISGAIYQLLNFTIIAGGLFLLSGFLHQRLGTTNLKNLGGIAKRMPVFASMFMLLGLASIGLPGTNGFIAEFLLLYSAFKVHLAAGILGLIVVILGAAYFTTHYRKTFFGPIAYPELHNLTDLTRRERFVGLSLCVLAIVFGLFPNLIINFIEASTNSWLLQVNR
jgi:NADH-quinone oxidoreductase subunit M